MFLRIYALEVNKVCTVANKLQRSVALSLQRTVRGGVEAHQLDLLQNLIGPTILTNLEDRWVWDLNGEGVFRVKDLRNLLDESFFPKDSTATRLVKSIPIKINVFAWKVYLDRLPARLNLIRRGVQVSSLSCLVCNAAYEDMSHLLFSCNLADDVVRLVCRWWNLTWSPLGSFSEWLYWFNSIMLCSRIKGCWKGFFTLHGGAYGISGTNCFLRLKTLGKMLFLTILYRALLLGVELDVIALLFGIAGFSILI
nr:RNA-directed DNA polymerase, eukaryota [Tanacetum cinerariifolium]